MAAGADINEADKTGETVIHGASRIGWTDVVRHLAANELRQRIGVKIGVTAEPWCHEATRDNIRHYAHGVGDDAEAK